MTVTEHAPTPRSGNMLRASMTPVTEEVSQYLEPTEGRVPERLVGVHFRNGPGRGETFGEPYHHPFDGDGMITRFGFEPDGRVHYRNRYVRTREFLAEEAAGRMLYRSFGTNLPGGLLRNILRMRFKNAANTSVVYHGGKLLALWEGGVPHALDPVTLETLGRDDLQGHLQNRRSLVDRVMAPELPFSAHPRFDRKTGVMWNFGTALGLPPRLMLYQIAPDGRCAPPREVVLGDMSFIHDFAMTPRFQVFMLTPVAFDIFRTLAGLSTPVASLSTDTSRPSEILLVPRDGGPTRRLSTGGCFVFHYTNAFEDAEGRVIMDGYRMDTMPSAQTARKIMAGENTGFGQPVLTRFTLDLSSGSVHETQLGEIPGELPTIHPDKDGFDYRYVWATAASTVPGESMFTGLQKLDLSTGKAIHRELAPDFPGEPLFVPDPEGDSEDAGWVLTLVYRSEVHRSDLMVLDARTLETVCRLPLPHHIPFGFHSTWVWESEMRGGSQRGASDSASAWMRSTAGG